MGNPFDIFSSPARYGDTDNTILLKIWWWISGKGGGGGGGIPVTVSPTTVTPNFISAAASSTTTIPIGAINASVLILTGTGTLNTVDQPVGVPWTEPNKLAATVTLVLASASTARVYYGT